MDEKKQPWDKLEGETEKAYNTFLLFADLPLHRRSVCEVYRLHPPKPKKQKKEKKRQKKPTNPPSSWYQWRKENDWDNRARARDAHRAEIERKLFLSQQHEALKQRKDSIDCMIAACESVLSEDNLSLMVASNPSSVVGYHKTLVSMRKETERDLFDLYTIKVQESPNEPTDEEKEEILSVIAMLKGQAKEGNTLASRLLLNLNGVKL